MLYEIYTWEELYTPRTSAVLTIEEQKLLVPLLNAALEAHGILFGFNYGH